MNEGFFLAESKALFEEMQGHRRYLHSHAEIGFALPNTLEYVRRSLTAMGLSPVSVGQAGLIADIAGDLPGRTILLRADMDALPMEEASGEPFSCKTGAMHGCGHDLHTAMLLGAGKLLLKCRQKLPGRARLLFQPAEEIFQGAQDVIAHGALEGVSAAAMVHVMTAVPFPTGAVLIPAAGISAPGADIFTADLTGKGAHGSSPHLGIDPLGPACRLCDAFTALISRELPPADSAVLTVGSLHAGDAPNRIPQTATLSGSLRTYREDVRTFLKNRMEEISQGLSKAYRVSVKLRFKGGCPCLENDESLCRLALDRLPALLGEGLAIDGSRFSGKALGAGSEDFAYIARQVPSIMLALGAGCTREGYDNPLHNPKARFDENAMANGCAALSYLAASWLHQNQ